jgi:hypothetical protein
MGQVALATPVSPAARWLLIYVSPECIPCDRLVAAIDEW